MKKQIKNRLPGPLTITFLILNILLLAILGSCQKEIGGKSTTSRIETDSTGTGDTTVTTDTTITIDTNRIKTDTTGTGLPGTFHKTYGGPNDEYIGNVEQTSDGGYVIIGTTRSYGAGDDDIYVIKVNAQGNIQWTKTYGHGEADPEEGCSIKQTKDGGYILGGAGYYEDYILIKMDAEGNLQWSKNYGYIAGLDYDVQLTDDGGYIIMGTYTSAGYALLIKTDVSGNVLWCRQYDLYGRVRIAQTIDGGYALVGGSYSGYSGSYSGPEMKLIKTDAHGDLLWSKGYSGCSPSSMKSTTDGGFIITGGTYSDVFVLKTDANGDQLWFKTYGGTAPKGVSEIEETADGGYVFSGTIGNYTLDGYILLTKINGSGEVTCSKIFGGGKEQYSYAHQTKDNGFIIASQTSAFGAGGSDIYLIKTDDNGNTDCYDNSYNLNVNAPALRMTNPFVEVSTGSIIFHHDLKTGTGGRETTICPK
jgi:hypothetical protein